MKKVLPLLLLVLLAFSGCQRGPAMYTQTTNPQEFVVNSEKFVKQTVKRSSHYSAADWEVAVEQFVAMSKNFVENRSSMNEEEIARFDAARLDFIQAVGVNGTEDLAIRIKTLYGVIVQ